MFKKCVRKFKVCFLTFFHKKHKIIYSCMSLLTLWAIICIYASIFAISGIFQMQLFSKYNETELRKIELGKNCYKLSSNAEKDFKLFDDILESKRKPKSGKSIFFHVTTCSTNGNIILNARQACAIESAAMWNDQDIFVLFAAPVGFTPNKIISPIINALLRYPNIHFRNINLITYSVGTPGETWIKTDQIYLSIYLESHLSDYLRFITLFKYGGIYLDLDVIVIRNFNKMPPNFAGAESISWTAVGVMGFESDEIGHKIVETVSRESIDKFSTDNWAANGVGALTRVLRKICHRNYTSESTPELCWGFKIFPPNSFYPIHWTKWETLFDTNETSVNEVLKAVTNSIVVHFWNKLSEAEVIDKANGITAYGILAERNCPKVFEASGRYF